MEILAGASSAIAAIQRIQLLAPTDEESDENGLLHYSFHAGLRLVLKRSSQFARLQKDDLRFPPAPCGDARRARRAFPEQVLPGRMVRELIENRPDYRRDD